MSACPKKVDKVIPFIISNAWQHKDNLILLLSERQTIKSFRSYDSRL